MVFNADRAIGRDIGGKLVFVSHAFHQGAGTQIDKALRELFM
jgi:hypothetical protein